MIGAIGIPTLLITLHSPADYPFITPDTDFFPMPPNAAVRVQSRLLRTNPVIGDCVFFAERGDYYLRRVLTPYYDVKDFWWRYKFQHRGNVHLHGLLWLNGAPDVAILD